MVFAPRSFGFPAVRGSALRGAAGRWFACLLLLPCSCPYFAAISRRGRGSFAAAAAAYAFPSPFPFSSLAPWLVLCVLFECLASVFRVNGAEWVMKANCRAQGGGGREFILADVFPASFVPVAHPFNPSCSFDITCLPVAAMIFAAGSFFPLSPMLGVEVA